MSKTGYVQNLAFVDGLDVEEKYALASHCIQLGDRTEGEKYREKLTEAGFGINNLPTKEEFNKQHSITLEPDKPKFSFIDLFAGIGGFRIAMQSLGGQCVFSSEWDEAVKETYFQNYGEVPFGDITKPEIKALIPDQFDVLCAGFPCQPFSNAGLKRGIEDTRGTLFYHIAEILRDHQPKAVLLENVRGLISNDKGNTIQTVLRTITGMGYKCNVSQELIENGPIKKLKEECSKMVLSAKDYGVPQNRPRIYIVLWRKDIDIETFVYPEPEKIKTSVGSILEKNVDDGVLPHFYVLMPFLYINFADNKCLPQRPYMVRLTIFKRLLVPSTKPLLLSLETAFSTASISFSNPLANEAISFIVDFL